MCVQDVYTGRSILDKTLIAASESNYFRMGNLHNITPLYPIIRFFYRIHRLSRRVLRKIRSSIVVELFELNVNAGFKRLPLLLIPQTGICWISISKWRPLVLFSALFNADPKKEYLNTRCALYYNVSGFTVYGFITEFTPKE